MFFSVYKEEEICDKSSEKFDSYNMLVIFYKNFRSAACPFFACVL